MHFSDTTKTCCSRKFGKGIIIDMKLFFSKTLFQNIFPVKDFCALLLIEIFAYQIPSLMRYDELLPIGIRRLIFRSNDLHLISGKKFRMQRYDLSIDFCPDSAQSNLCMNI